MITIYKCVFKEYKFESSVTMIESTKDWKGYVLNKRIEECLRIPQVPQRSTEWFEMRKGRITGSIVDTILGTNPYASYEQLVAEKAGMPNEFKGNAATQHGTKYEPEAIALYEETTGRKVIELGLVPHPDCSILAHSPDGISVSESDTPCLLEIKCPLRRKITEDVPKHYMGQLQLGMEVFDVPYAHFAQYKPEPYTFHISTVYREEDWLNKHMPEFTRFWDTVEEWKKYGWREHPLARNIVEKEIVQTMCML